ncbi:hypothetical protein RclHR1_02860012 [Rhizophagus clarus]|uniref:RING-type domain-containing protein n=1 Tax=Rhizophagus clarus TaxID=94130 RepID=A0A2Z6RHK6_9GLOM|nr:hypothetical protein RclHR1_02860012 [Rhizophagus clarus]
MFLCGEGLYLPREFLPFKEFTLASCGHVYHQKCLEKHLVNGEAICPNKKCNKAIETFLSPELLKGSQDKPSTADENTTSKPVDSENATPMGEDANGLFGGEEQSSSKTTDKASSSIQFNKETSDQATSPIEAVSTTSGNDSISKKFSSGKIQHPICKKCSEEISLESRTRELEEASGNETSNFLQLYDKIDSAESNNEYASRGLIFSYFDFGLYLDDMYKELKLEHGKDGSQALIKNEVREAIPEAKCSDEAALRKRMKRFISFLIA